MEMTSRIIEGLRLRILRSRFTQRKVEERASFSRGYLSQLLSGAIDLKYKHVMAILHALEIDPSEFFGDLFPRHRHPALASLEEVAIRSEEGSLSHALAGLFSMGVETVLDVKERLARCEAAVEELTELGLLPKRDKTNA